MKNVLFQSQRADHGPLDTPRIWTQTCLDNHLPRLVLSNTSISHHVEDTLKNVYRWTVLWHRKPLWHKFNSKQIYSIYISPPSNPKRRGIKLLSVEKSRLFDKTLSHITHAFREITNFCLAFYITSVAKCTLFGVRSRFLRQTWFKIQTWNLWLQSILGYHDNAWHIHLIKSLTQVNQPNL